MKTIFYMRTNLKENYGRVHQNVDILRVKLQDAQVALHSCPFHEELQSQEKAIREEFITQLDAYVKLLKQQNRADWISEGYQSNNFAYLKQRKQHFVVYELKDSQQRSFEGKEEVAHDLIKFCKDMLGKQHINRNKTHSQFLGMILDCLVSNYCSCVHLYISYDEVKHCLLYTSPSPRDGLLSRMPSSA